MFDNTCKFFAENYPEDMATWLIGRPIQLSKLDPKELSNEPIRADSLILLQSNQLILHIEFQTDPDAAIPFRMADYRLRIHRRYPHKSVIQVVVYLRESSNPLVYQTRFELPGTGSHLRHQFQVIRMWEQPTANFLTRPGLLPFAVLSKTEERSQVLQSVAQQLETIQPKRSQENLAASTALLAGLVLEEDIVQQLLRKDIMRESVMYQVIKEEGKAEGIAEGKAEGITEGKLEVARNLLREGMDVEAIARVTGLSLEQIQQLNANPTDE